MSSRTLTVTLECAGNGRRFLHPPVPGEQWGLGAVGTARWTGVPLKRLLDRVGLPSGAREVFFRGADEGTPKDLARRIAYERSLPLAAALRDDVLVAFAMEGSAIPPEHGGPLRLIVPGWYGMASVKWLAHIRFVDEPFQGFFQKDRYVIAGEALGEIAPRAVITRPADGADVRGPVVEVEGFAWSGAARIVKVEVAARPPRQSGATHWREAELGRVEEPYAWRPFNKRLLVDAPGPVALEVVARATDGASNVQPLEPVWNALGYRNNAARPVRIRVIS
jgi:DMSO/TMAO reductase YedYZ molybdopterin-dependent catalytic subunit